MPNHLKKLFNRLKKGSLTRLTWYKETMDMNLERRIYDLRELFHKGIIKQYPQTKMVKVNGKLIARYSL